MAPCTVAFLFGHEDVDVGHHKGRWCVAVGLFVDLTLIAQIQDRVDAVDCDHVPQWVREAAPKKLDRGLRAEAHRAKVVETIPL